VERGWMKKVARVQKDSRGASFGGEKKGPQKNEINGKGWERDFAKKNTWETLECLNDPGPFPEDEKREGGEPHSDKIRLHVPGSGSGCKERANLRLQRERGKKDSSELSQVLIINEKTHV